MKKLLNLILTAILLLSLTSCASDAPQAEITETAASSETAATTVPTETTAATTTTTTEPVPEFSTVSFLAVGDNLIHSSIYKQAAARADGEGYDFAYAYERIAAVVRRADIAVINQETLICNDVFEPSTYPLFNSPTALGDHMLDIGFDVFTIANNHTLDKGTEGLSACLDYWDTKNAVVCGAYRNAEDRDNIRTAEVEGITFSFLSYTESLNGLRLPQGSPLIIGDCNDIDTMTAEIKRAKEISDVCVVALHWGVENSDIISDYQRNVAKQLSDAGADIIIGNHPHVLRDIEEIEREDGTVTLCAYSLGNFISAQSVGQNLIGGILKFDVSLRTDENASDSDKPIIDHIKLVPIVTHFEGNYKNVRIYPLSEYTEELAESHGVKNMSKFGYDYIFEVLERNINEKYLDID
ncbi:MAG: CapA family protein [Ruminococcus sp.]|nr:CapA family protein [Ruminococcus sp.]MCM1480455.1 CapA family protein [Muribaculaceae bacterium]